MNTNAKTELRRAYLMIEWGRLDDALAACDRAAALIGAPHPLPHAVAGSLLSSFGHHTEALQRLRKAIRIDPEDVFTKIVFAETCLFMGRSKQARRALDRIETSDKGLNQWREHLLSLEHQISMTDGIVVRR